ncbi:MAG: PhzF family phenazine biosynthesis protein, partial [Burkholderiales bacterium]|nr:PhzF family phenazine biosynthesis protein [Burkholderiales bacterium]
MPELRRFVQVDVFTATPLKGNALAVVVDGAGLSDDEMATFARWTHLSETTFLLPPTDPAADYRVRIFTPGGELPFAGHPTLGSAHAWLASGGDPKRPGEVVQQCEIGLVRVRHAGTRFAFAAPPLRRSGPVDAAGRAQVLTSLRISPEALLDLVWVDNGPGWMAARL